jgi:CubicO group peptidase (beta-lactamase class C family)
MIEDAIDRLAAETGFSGVVRVDAFAKAYGLAHRGAGIANAVDTRFAIASGGKGPTALAVMSLIEAGVLKPSTTARSILGADLPLIDDAVTVEHLLAHRSGIGDYCDEDAGHDVNDYIMPVPVHELADTEQFVRALDGHPPKFPPGERFSYCNAGFVVLALIAERASRIPFPN